MFIHLDRASHVPIYLQIKESMRSLILESTLRPGDRLPSTRQLAATLGINRMTVEAAFGQLEADGLISSHVGRGTFVTRAPAPELNPRPDQLDSDSVERLWAPLFADDSPALASLPTAAPRNGSKAISFVSAAPGPELFPAIEFRRCADFVLKRRAREITSIGSCEGLAPLKSYLARWLSQNGTHTHEDEIIITTGCQQSMDLIRKALVGPGDSIVMENPTYPGAIVAFTISGERLQLPVQEGGPDLRILSSLVNRNRCKLIYTSPNFQNPTGRTMPFESRRQLVAFAAQFRVPIVEDDVFGELRYSGPVLPTLRSLCPEMVIHIGSFSKTLSTTLRIGWMAAPRPFIRQAAMLKQSVDLHTSLFLQATMDEFCRRDLLNRHMKRVRRIYARRRDVMAECVRKHFPSETRCETPDGGLCMWVSLPHDCNVQELLRLASEKGVQFIPGSAFYFRSPQHNSIRLSFAAEPEERIKEGLRILGSVLGSDRSRFYFNAPLERERSQLIL